MKYHIRKRNAAKYNIIKLQNSEWLKKSNVLNGDTLRFFPPRQLVFGIHVRISTHLFITDSWLLL